MSKETYVIDPSHTLVEFSVKHMMIATVKGRFVKVAGTVAVDLTDISTAVFDVEVDMESLDTRESQRDEHLRSADFFDVQNHPRMTFRSRSVSPKGDGYQVVGDLTIRGITRETTFHVIHEGDARDPWGNQRVGFSASARLNRKEFGLMWNVALETGGWLVGEEVKMEVHVEAVKQPGNAVA